MKGLVEILNSERFDRFGSVDYYDTMTVKIGHSTMEKLRKLDIKSNHMGVEIDFEPTEYKSNCANDTIDGLTYAWKILDDNIEEKENTYVKPPIRTKDYWHKAVDYLRVRYCNEPKTEVIFNEPATVLYKDGKKYVCKCDKEDKFSEELGLALCLLKSFGVSYRDFEELLKGAKRKGVKNEKNKN